MHALYLCFLFSIALLLLAVLVDTLKNLATPAKWRRAQVALTGRRAASSETDTLMVRPTDGAPVNDDAWRLTA